MQLAEKQLQIDEEVQRTNRRARLHGFAVTSEFAAKSNQQHYASANDEEEATVYNASVIDIQDNTTPVTPTSKRSVARSKRSSRHHKALSDLGSSQM